MPQQGIAAPQVLRVDNHYAGRAVYELAMNHEEMLVQEERRQQQRQHMVEEGLMMQRERERERINRINPEVMTAVEEAMRARHLNKPERDEYHNPRPDWHDTKKGDVLKSASTLEVEDIIRKHIK